MGRAPWMDMADARGNAERFCTVLEIKLSYSVQAAPRIFYSRARGFRLRVLDKAGRPPSFPLARAAAALRGLRTSPPFLLVRQLRLNARKLIWLNSRASRVTACTMGASQEASERSCSSLGAPMQVSIAARSVLVKQ